MSESDPANCIGCLDKADFSKSYTLPRERAAGGKTKDQRKAKIRIGAFPTTPLLPFFRMSEVATNLLNRDVKLHNQTRKQWKTTCEDASGYQRVDDAILDDVHNQ